MRAEKYHQRLHALDSLRCGVTPARRRLLQRIQAQGDNTQNGDVVSIPFAYAERAALLLLNGNIYTRLTSHCTWSLYRLVMAYSESTLQQTQLLEPYAERSRGSIWMRRREWQLTAMV